MENKIIKGFFGIGIGTCLNLILGLLTTPIVTRIVDPTSLGRFSNFTTYSGLILEMCFMGLNQAFPRFFISYDDEKRKNALVKMCVILPFVFSLVIMLCAYILNSISLIDFSIDRNLLVYVIVYIFVSIWNTIATCLLTVEYRTFVYSLCSSAQKIVYFLILVIFNKGIKNNYLELLIIATILSIASSSIIATVFSKKYWIINLNILPNNYLEVIKYAFPFIFYNFMESLFDSMSKFFIDYHCTDYDMGIYTSALNLIGIFSIIKVAFSTVWNPAQTEQYTKNPDDTTFIQKGNRYMTIIMFFVGLSVICFKDILCYMLGESYRGASSIIPFLVFSPIMYTLVDTTGCGIEVSKKSYLLVNAVVISLAVSFISNLVLVNALGLEGASIATAISCITFFSTRTYYSIKNYYINYELKKMYLFLALLLIFALINTFITSFIVNIVIYMMLVIVLICIYKKDIFEMINFVKSLLFKTN